jgi:hypothetical protein
MTNIENSKQVTPTQMVIYQLKNMIDYHFTKSEWMYLAYAYLYPKDFKDRLVNELIVTNRYTVNNMTAKFTKLKLISCTKIPGSRARNYSLSPLFDYIKLDQELVYSMHLILNS